MTAAVALAAADRYARRAQPLAGRRWATPGDLARAINPETVQTEALDVIDAETVRAWTTPDARLIISMPPQEGKSERVTKTSTLWALTDNPDRRIAIASYAMSLAEGFGGDIRNWITTHDGTDGTLDLGLRIARDNGAKRRWRIAGRKGGIISVGIGSGFTGRPADALVIDDPFSGPEQADVEWYREKVWEWWQAVSGPRLAPGAPVIVILTRWHEDDLAGRLIAKQAEDAKSGAEHYDRWRVVNIPALADHDPEKGQTDPLGRQPGVWLNSARKRTVAQWEAIRLARGSRVFNALYQGRPSPDSGNVWRRGWWARYETLPIKLDAADEVIQSWDMTFKDTKGSDFVVGQVWARKGAEVFLLDQVRRRMSFTETVAAVQAMTLKWPQAKAKLVEDKANGPAVLDSLRRKVPGLIAVTPTESKLARAYAVSPFVEARNVYLPDASVALFDVQGLIDEAAAFPNGTHDDQVDATSQALARLLLDGTGAAAWTEWLRKRAAQAAVAAASASVEPQPAAGAAEPATTATGPAQTSTHMDARAAARQAAFKAARGGGR
ncbi:MAG: phage terminase large subunit [Jatrophihabitans sp.]|uniref:phage terminase large subunit n=1 Tax=Jatrophihabitans sp. TaxID=1932789 RepID=UPI003F7E2E3A